jgi:TRAP-type C4-dicarboxylate transport system permease small subunit
MSEPALPVEAGGAVAAPQTALERLTGHVAVLGGALTLVVALVATASVLMRWLFNAPIDGDFEYVKMVTACAVFAYLPYTQARRGNIMVDTFTSFLPQGLLDGIDAFWDLVFAALMGYLTYCLVYGTLSNYVSGETTMQRQIVLWPSIALCTALSALLVVTTIGTALKLMTKTTARGPS